MYVVSVNERKWERERTRREHSLKTKKETAEKKRRERERIY